MMCEKKITAQLLARMHTEFVCVPPVVYAPPYEATGQVRFYSASLCTTHTHSQFENLTDTSFVNLKRRRTSTSRRLPRNGRTVAFPRPARARARCVGMEMTMRGAWWSQCGVGGAAVLPSATPGCLTLLADAARASRSVRPPSAQSHVIAVFRITPPLAGGSC